jgi:hypothetical protein
MARTAKTAESKVQVPSPRLLPSRDIKMLLTRQLLPKYLQSEA